MDKLNRGIRLTSLLLIAGGVLLLGANIFSGGAINVTLPFVFLMLGGAFFILVLVFSQKWSWASFLFIPGALLVTFGLIFLLNTLTNDWNAWAYAWLLLLAGTGVGVALAGWYGQLGQTVTLVGVGATVLGVTLFALFGAIAGGAFILAMAPILLALGGLALFLVKPEVILPDKIRHQLHLEKPQVSENHQLPYPLKQSQLVEPLSIRELEVLRLIDQGLSNSEIAERLSLAPSTVKTHINNIYGKLGVQTRVQALMRARELQLLP